MYPIYFILELVLHQSQTQSSCVSEPERDHIAVGSHIDKDMVLAEKYSYQGSLDVM